MSTQNTQYDGIGSKYNDIKSKDAIQPELPSVVQALGDISGKRCLGTLAFSLSPPPLPPASSIGVFVCDACFGRMHMYAGRVLTVRAGLGLQCPVFYICTMQVLPRMPLSRMHGSDVAHLS